MQARLTPVEDQLISSLVDCGALRFGSFILKSGRHSPYFFNSGDLLSHSKSLNMVGQALANTLVNLPCDYVFGPAYKGIALAASALVAAHQHHGRNLPWGYNRKEIKDHGEGGAMVGATPQGNIVVIDDVLTSGKAAREAITVLAPHKPVALLVLLDRQEHGPGGQAASLELQRDCALQVHSLLSFNMLVTWMHTRPEQRQQLEQLLAYAKNSKVG